MACHSSRAPLRCAVTPSSAVRNADSDVATPGVLRRRTSRPIRLIRLIDATSPRTLSILAFDPKYEAFQIFDSVSFRTRPHCGRENGTASRTYLPGKAERDSTQRSIVRRIGIGAWFGGRRVSSDSRFDEPLAQCFDGVPLRRPSGQRGWRVPLTPDRCRFECHGRTRPDCSRQPCRA